MLSKKNYIMKRRNYKEQKVLVSSIILFKCVRHTFYGQIKIWKTLEKIKWEEKKCMNIGTSGSGLNYAAVDSFFIKVKKNQMMNHFSINAVNKKPPKSYFMTINPKKARARHLQLTTWNVKLEGGLQCRLKKLLSNGDGFGFIL